jgi:hypothetical protein
MTIIDQGLLATIGGAFSLQPLSDIPLKKVIKLVAIMAGLFFAALIYAISTDSQYKLE